MTGVIYLYADDRLQELSLHLLCLGKKKCIYLKRQSDREGETIGPGPGQSQELRTPSNSLTGVMEGQTPGPLSGACGRGMGSWKDVEQSGLEPVLSMEGSIRSGHLTCCAAVPPPAPGPVSQMTKVTPEWSSAWPETAELESGRDGI